MTERTYTERLRLMGLDADCEKFLAAIPADRVGFWDRILVIDALPGEGPLEVDDLVAYDKVGIAFIKGRRTSVVPVSVSILKDPMDLPRWVEEQARRSYLRAQEAAPDLTQHTCAP